MAVNLRIDQKSCKKDYGEQGGIRFLCLEGYGHMCAVKQGHIKRYIVLNFKMQPLPVLNRFTKRNHLCCLYGTYTLSEPRKALAA